jgi:hypothetical protein
LADRAREQARGAVHIAHLTQGGKI